MPTVGYQSLAQANAAVINNYNKVRPHQNNGGLTPNESELRYWNTYKSETNIS